MENQKYYWLKLKRDFFKRHDILIVENMPNGKDYILFYLKLLCESVDHNGNLRFSDSIPYNEQMLSTITNTNIDVVRSAIKVFTELKMMDTLDDGTIFMNEVHKMIGSETKWAEKKRLQRDTNNADFFQKNISESEDNVPKMSRNVQKMSLECPEMSRNVLQNKNNILELDLDNNTNNITNNLDLKDLKDLRKERDIYISHKEKIKKDIETIIFYLNSKTGKRFTTKNKVNLGHINARLSEGFSVEDFKKVIDNKCKEWLGTKYENYLRPETLFNSKFESYLNSTPINYNPSTKQSKLYETGDEI